MTLVHKPEPGDLLIPRQYQEEIFLKAQQKNVIAVLDTGSGKTLISALLIKWITSQECPQKKVVIFLVPKVPLVEQQGNFIAQHTALRVALVHSEVSAGVMDRTRWSNLFSQADVLVMTGERRSLKNPFFPLIEFRANLLECAYALSLEHEQGMRPVDSFTRKHFPDGYQVSLVVFDECHHARKNHPYTSIMAIYQACPEPERPKIFGMTACPTWTSTPHTSLVDLEKNLNAQIVTVQDNLDEFSLYSSKPIEVEWCAGVPTRDDPSQRHVAGHPRISATPQNLFRISYSLYLDSL
jgi:endoribonuclease Dicer